MWVRAVKKEGELKVQYFPTAGEEASYPSVDHLASYQQEELLQITPEGLFREQPRRTRLSEAFHRHVFTVP